ncbi:MAG: hypothetical protein ACFFE8_10235 [Candidatus Heimdallarchaeota archaeon]
MKSIRDLLFIIIFVSLVISIPILAASKAVPTTDEITFKSVMVDGDTQEYILYAPTNPRGAVLVLPSLHENHFMIFTEEEILNDQLEKNSIIKAAKKFGLALVLAEGVPEDWYSPNNGEKKVLACLEAANATLKIASHYWFVYGFSMGGTGAITISLRHPNLFAGIYNGDGMAWYNPAATVDTWDNSSDFYNLDPLLNLEFFGTKTLFLASGTNYGQYGTNVLAMDNFSQGLTSLRIKHYYYRGKEPHSTLLLYNSVNLTFNMFAHHITGTLDKFYDDPSMYNTVAPEQPTGTSGTTPAWPLYVLLAGILVLTARKRAT